MNIGRIGTPEEGARWKRTALECGKRGAELEAENAALWAFVRALDTWDKTEAKGIELEALYQQVLAARNALRQYEEKGKSRAKDEDPQIRDQSKH